MGLITDFHFLGCHIDVLPAIDAPLQPGKHLNYSQRLHPHASVKALNKTLATEALGSATLTVKRYLVLWASVVVARDRYISPRLSQATSCLV